MICLHEAPVEFTELKVGMDTKNVSDMFAFKIFKISWIEQSTQLQTGKTYGASHGKY